MSEYYDHTTYPAAGVKGQSAAMRAELELIDTGFAKLPTLAGNGLKAVVINSLGTALAVTVGTLALAGNFATTGAYNTTLVQQASTTVTLPTTNSVMARTDAAQTFTGVQTFSAQPILSSLTASQAVFTDGSKGLVSNAVTGTGNVVMSNDATLVAPVLGTPASGVATNLTGLPLTTGVAGILPTANGGTGIAYFTAAGPTSARIYTFPDSAATILYSGGALGTPSSGVATNLTGTAAGLTAGTASAVAVGGITGLGTGVATALAVNVGSAGAFVTFNGALGTPSSGVATNLTGIPAAQLSGTITSATQDLITRTGTLTSGATGSGFGALVGTSLSTGSGSISGGAGSFTTGAFSGAITSTLTSGTVLNSASATTATILLGNIQNTSGRLLLGIEGSAASGLLTGSTAYAGVFTTGATGQPIQFGVSDVLALSIAGSGNRITIQEAAIGTHSDFIFLKQNGADSGFKLAIDSQSTGNFLFTSRTAGTDLDIITVTKAGAVTIPGTLGVTGALTAASLSTGSGAISGGAISGTTLTESTGAAWTDYTPTITADTGTWGALTVTTARYRLLGKTLLIALNVNAAVNSGSPTEGRILLPLSKTSGVGQVYAPAFLNANGTPAIGYAGTGNTTFITFSKVDASAFTGTVYMRAMLAVDVQ